MPRGRPRKKPKPEAVRTEPEPEVQAKAPVEDHGCVENDHIPSISDQGFVAHKIDNEKLLGEPGTPRFNGSIVRFKGKLLLGYRYYNPKDEGKTQIGIAELDEDYNVVQNTHVNLTPHGSTRIFEDCRLFEHNGKLYMSFAELDIIGYPSFRVIQRLVQLGTLLQQARDFRLHVGGNYKKVEKNWSYYSDNGVLRCIYDIPTQHTFDVDEVNGVAVNEQKGKPIIWSMGHLRGGTPLLPFEDGFIGFHHTGTDHEWLMRRYGMGVFTFKNKRLTGLSYGFLYGTQREEWCGKGNPRCVFPSGIVDDGDKYLVSCGVNDTFNSIVEVPKTLVAKYIEPISHFEKDHGRCFRIRKRKPIMTLFGTEYVGLLVGLSGIHGCTHIFKTEDCYAIASLEKSKNVEDITLEEYERLASGLRVRNQGYTIPDYILKKKR